MVTKPRIKKYARDAILMGLFSAYIIYQMHKAIVRQDVVQIAIGTAALMFPVIVLVPAARE